MGVLKQADGSSFLELGNTKVLASIYGPHNVSEVCSHSGFIFNGFKLFVSE